MARTAYRVPALSARPDCRKRWVHTICSQCSNLFWTAALGSSGEGPHLVQDLDGSSAMRREAAGSSLQCSGWLRQDSRSTSSLRAMAARSFLQMHRPSAFLISLQGVSEVCLRALRTRKPSSSTISSWWMRRARMRSSKRWQPIPQCSSCSVAAARFRDGLPSMGLRQELTIEPEDLRLELWTSAMSEASISRLRMHRFWRRAPRATRS